MSSRALRRLQREQEEQRLREKVTESPEEEDEDDDVPAPQVKKSAFDLLNAMEDEDGGEDEDAEQEDDADADSEPLPESNAANAGKASKKAKKKKKKKGKAKAAQPENGAPTPAADVQMDEIDLALKSLGTSARPGRAPESLVIDQELQKFYSLLAVDKQHLNALNEMKKLFGNVVLERDDDEDNAAARRQANNQGVAISDFLSARYSRVSRGQGLSGLALRQNVFMAGRPEWPKAASGGLGMELVERADDFTIEYRFVHSALYQRVQREFEQAVQTMDPQAMFQMVWQNPYHISSLLQTGEILKHQGDHSVAADMYERALYSFGRSVQSTFAAALAEGKARMDFRRPENREFWLTAYRYIGALVQKGTFRTAYEWAKLLLSLDPEGDPYCVRLIIDQLAIRGGQSEHLIALAGTRIPLIDWGQGSPNIQISLALAHFRSKHVDEAQDSLAIAVHDHPWIFARLFQQLDIDRTPKAIWGAQPRTDLEKYQTEAYVSRASDVWNTPETISFLRDVIEKLPRNGPPKPDTRSISLDEARHAFVSEIPSLIGTVPREFTTARTTSSDPLPPPDTMDSYDSTGARGGAEDSDSDSGHRGQGNFDEREKDRIIDRARAAATTGNRAGANGGTNGVLGLLGRALGMFTGRGNVPPAVTPGNEEGGGVEENLGAQLGMEQVQVRSMDEYEAALNRGQWPVLDEAAAPEVMRQLAEQPNAMARIIAGDQSTPAELAQARQEDAAGAQAMQAEAQEARREMQSRRQATVEDEADEDDEEAAPPPPQQVAIGSMTREEIADMLSKDYDNEANKRWLAGRGMLALKEFTAAHGADEKAWLTDPRVDKAPLTEYLARVSLLRPASDRNFILEFALKQGAGAPSSEMVKRLL